MKLSGAQILIECLLKEKVEVMFGIPGGALLPIFDVLYDAPIKFILTRHEQAAAHMADGYARASGKVGVCMATSGPGATNLTTGIATAYMDSIPLVAITGQVASNLIGNDAFQEADTVGITRSITKYNYLVKDVKNLAQTVKEAFYIARTGRPGPVLIDIPSDVQREITDFIYPEGEIKIRGYNPTIRGNLGQIKKGMDLLKKAKRPVLCVGGGVIISQASSQLLKFIEATNIPVTTTLMGIGAIPYNHPLYLGMLGMHGTQYANKSVQNSDLLIGIGVRFDDRVTGKTDAFAPQAKKIHIDIDPTSISKNIKIDIPIVGDAYNVLAQMNKLLEESSYDEIKKEKRKEWLAQIEEWKKEYPLIYKKDNKIKPQYIIEEVNKLTGGEVIVTTEVGQNQMWVAQYFAVKHPRSFITSGGLGTMGYGFPAAIGAKVAYPNKEVIDFAGDGSFQMNIQELATVSANKIKVIVIIFNNCYLGMVRQWQELFYKKRYSFTYLGVCPDFAQIAQAFGLIGIKVTKKEEVRKALETALSADKTVVIDFHIDPEEKVFPMVPGGASLDEIISGLA